MPSQSLSKPQLQLFSHHTNTPPPSSQTSTTRQYRTSTTRIVPQRIHLAHNTLTPINELNFRESATTPELIIKAERQQSNDEEHRRNE